MKDLLLLCVRRIRVIIKKLAGREPSLPISMRVPTEYFGSQSCGWGVPLGILSQDSILVDVGLGEDISFSQALINRYNCVAHGFDPTPKAIRYVEENQPAGFVLHKYGVANASGHAVFYLPNNDQHVSGSILPSSHVGSQKIEVELCDLRNVLSIIGA